MHGRFAEPHATNAAVAAEDFRKPYLDGLRGSAACVVLFGHVAIALNFPLLGILGNAAVCVFFVLSAYVLADLSRRSTLSVPAQAVRRYLRLIVPMLLTSTFAWALLAAGLYQNQEASALTGSQWLSWWYGFDPSFSAMVAETIYGVFVTGQSLYNCNLWTMRPELIGSLYIFIISTAPNRNLRALCYLALAAFYATDYLPLFSVGALLFEFHPEVSKIALRGRQAAAMLPAIPLAIGLFLCLMISPQPGFIARLYALLPRLSVTDNEMHWHMIGATLVVATVLHWPLLQRTLGSRIGRFLGRISFTLYLIHIPIICSLTAWIVMALATLPVPIASAIAAVITITSVFAIAAMVCRFVDEFPTRFSREAGRFVDLTSPAITRGAIHINSTAPQP